MAKMTAQERKELLRKYGDGSGGFVGGRGSFTPRRTGAKTAAPAVTAVERSTAKSTDELRLVGKPLPVVDGVAKVTGAAKYANDITLPGQLYAKTLRSPF